MRITNVSAVPLAIPTKEPYLWSGGQSFGVNPVLVRIETDEGIIGIGESGGDRAIEATLGVIGVAARLLNGTDPFDIELFLDRFYRVGKFTEVRRLAHQGLAGVEMALWDLVGKACGQPVHRLLGGAYRKEVNFFGFLQGDSPEALADSACYWVNSGSTTLYMKVGRANDEDVAFLSAVRAAAGPDVKLRIDANQAWTVGAAIRQLSRFAEFDIEFVEQPVHWADLEGMKRVRWAVPIPVAIDQGCFTEYDVLRVLQSQCADVVVVGMHDAGGLLPLKKVAAVAAAGGLPLCRHGISGESGRRDAGRTSNTGDHPQPD